jgi:excisionase family DNA binding protein
MERLLRLPEAAELLSVSARTVYRLVAEGRLPAIRIRDHFRLDPADLRAFVVQGKEQNSFDTGCHALTDRL